MHKKVLLVLSSLLSVFSSFGYIIKFEQWQKDGKSVYLLADVHIKTDHVHAQKEDLLAAAKNLKNVVFIAEDSFHIDPLWYRSIHNSNDNIDNMIAKVIHDMELENNQRDQFLAYSTRLFEMHGLRSYNAELRHLYRLWGEGEVGVALFNQIKQFLDEKCQKNCSKEVGDWIRSHFIDTNEQSLGQRFHALLDAHFVLLTDESIDNSDNVIVAAGFQHILPVREFLIKQGFNKISETGTDEILFAELEKQMVPFDGKTFVEQKVRPVDIFSAFELQAYMHDFAGASSSSSSSRLLDSYNHVASYGLSIADLLKEGKCPEIITEGGKRRILFQGMGLTSLNGLKDIHGIETVEHIDLSDNKLSDLRFYDFQAMHSVQKINLNNNQISHISPFCFASMLHVVSLDLRNNLLEDIDQSMFAGPFFSRIYLQRNKIQKIPLGLKIKFADDGNESFINFESNPLVKSPRDNLLIKSNHEVQVKYDITIDQLLREGSIQLESCGQEVCLRLNGKGLTSLQGLENIPDINKVAILDLSNNKISSISQEDFPQIGSLRLIDLSGNRLTTIPERCFASFDHIETLNLCGNMIACLHQNSFEGPTIGRVWLSQNRLSSLPVAMKLCLLSKNAQKICEVMLTQNQFEYDPTLSLRAQSGDEKVFPRIYVDEKLKKVTFKNGIKKVNVTVKDGSVVELDLDDLLQLDWLKTMLSSPSFDVERFIKLNGKDIQCLKEEEAQEYNYGYGYIKEVLPLLLNEQSVFWGMDKEFIELFFNVLKTLNNAPADVQALLQQATPVALVNMCYYSDYFIMEDLNNMTLQVAAQRLSEIAQVEQVDEKLHFLLKDKILSYVGSFDRRPVKFNFLSPDNNFKFYKNYILHWQKVPATSYYHMGFRTSVPERVIGSIFERSSCALVDRFEASPLTQDITLSPDGKNIIIDSKIISPMKTPLSLGKQNDSISFKRHGDACVIGRDILLDLRRKTIKIGNVEEGVPELNRGEIEQINWDKDQNVLQIILIGEGQLLYSFDPQKDDVMNQSFMQIAQRLNDNNNVFASDNDDPSVAASSS